MRTFTDRVEGLRAWMFDTELWSWFGVAKTNSSGVFLMQTHDQLGGILEKYGALAFFTIVFTGIAFLIFCHKRIFALRNPMERKLATLYLSVLFGVVYTGILSGSSLSVFPINVFFWLLVGFLMKQFFLPIKEEDTSMREPTSISITIDQSALSGTAVGYYGR